MSGLSCGKQHLIVSLRISPCRQADRQAVWVVAVPGLSFFVACGTLVLRPGTKPMSSALQGKFLTTGIPDKSSLSLLLYMVQEDALISILNDILLDRES